MTSVVIVLAVISAVMCWPRRSAPRERIAVLARMSTVEARPVPELRRSMVLAAVLAVIAAVAAGASWPWVAVLVVAGIGGGRVRRKQETTAQDVALAADLMAACMAAGAGVVGALGAASASVDGPLRELADPVVEELRRGTPPEQAWAPWLADERLAPLARSCVRSSGSGAAVAAELVRVAARVRARHRSLVQERIARASVWVVLPLGLCFLPAFVVVGVVPLVMGLLQTLH
jgi:Flp pilus assembly protein TadB